MGALNNQLYSSTERYLHKQNSLRLDIGLLSLPKLYGKVGPNEMVDQRAIGRALRSHDLGPQLRQYKREGKQEASRE
jgi:hypothetical protein